MLKISRNSDNRANKCVAHRVADIAGGVGVRTSNLGGKVLYEGTPLAKGENGLYEVVKTAKLVTNANSQATRLEIAKGSHFVVGDYIGFSSAVNGVQIAAIDKSNASKDILTVASIAAELKAGAVGVETTSTASYNPKLTAVAVAGSNNDVVAGEICYTDAWVIAVVNESNAPAVNDAIKSANPAIRYV